MDKEEISDMLVADDKFESYRLGYKRGHDRGYEFAKQQDKREIETIKIAHGVTESMLKIAYNDITAFIASEDRMKEDIKALKQQAGWLKW